MFFMAMLFFFPATRDVSVLQIDLLVLISTEEDGQLKNFRRTPSVKYKFEHLQYLSRDSDDDACSYEEEGEMEMMFFWKIFVFFVHPSSAAAVRTFDVIYVT
jgi:hypothetical protein